MFTNDILAYLKEDDYNNLLNVTIEIIKTYLNDDIHKDTIQKLVENENFKNNLIIDFMLEDLILNKNKLFKYVELSSDNDDVTEYSVLNIFKNLNKQL